MATLSRSPVALSGTAATDLLRSSTNGVSGVPLRTLGGTRFSLKKRDFSVVAKIRKVKKQERHPWPDNPDPNVPGGILSHLSHFKPLKEKPKPVALEFEKNLVEIERQKNDVQKIANEVGLDLTDHILSLENRHRKELKYLHTHLTPIQRVQIARHPNRPTFLDHVFSITEKFVELHGDRAGYDDPAIVTGIGTIDGRRYMFIGHQKGRDTKENIKRNFGMPTPHGYRKALRMMYYADHHKFPIVTFIDTPGAFADLKCEELGQGEAIAQNLRTMFGLKVPVISIVIGEGGSGGALAIGCANYLLMLENAVFYVASPEAAAAILWKSAKEAPKAARKLRITAAELCKMRVADGIIPEPLGGAHADPSWTSQQIKNAINAAMDSLTKLDTEELLLHRTLKFRKIGGLKEEITIDPKKKVNMKKKDKRVAGKTPVMELERDVEKLKARVSKAKESSSKPPKLSLDEKIVKLKKELDLEFSLAAKAMGYSDRFTALRKEFMEANSKKQPIDPILLEKIEKLENEFTQNLSAAPNYAILKPKCDILNELSKAKIISEKNAKAKALKEVINKKLIQFMDRSDIKEKIDALKAEAQNGELDEEMRERIAKTGKEIELELTNVLKPIGLNDEIIGLKAKELCVQTIYPDLKSKVQSLNEQTNKTFEEFFNSSGLKDMFDVLKLEIANACKKPDAAAKIKIKALGQQIMKKLSAAPVIDTSELEDKHEELQGKITKAMKLLESSNGSPKSDFAANADPESDDTANADPESDDTANADSTADESRVEFHIGANNSVA